MKTVFSILLGIYALILLLDGLCKYLSIVFTGSKHTGLIYLVDVVLVPLAFASLPLVCLLDSHKNGYAPLLLALLLQFMLIVVEWAILHQALCRVCDSRDEPRPTIGASRDLAFGMKYLWLGFLGLIFIAGGSLWLVVECILPALVKFIGPH